MAETQHLSRSVQIYVAVVAASGLAALLHSVYTFSLLEIGYEWFVLAGLTLLSGSFTVRIPSIPARLSVSETFVFAAVLLFGPSAATLVVVLDALVISLWQRRKVPPLSRLVFNLAAPAVAIWTSSHVFFWLADIQPLYNAPQPILSLVFPLLALAVLYFLLNSWLIAIAVALEKRASAFRVWRDNFLWLSLNFLSGASVALLLLPYIQRDQGALLRLAGILLPLLIISYLTLRTALGRVEDANRHLSELNSLYLSTVETLAMAIDAKDQITHGHIRRVQHYAVELSKYVGVRDTQQIKAIEAASLLHDMGKLAVPEYILNKPGKLTAAEFEKMKLHASVGADILSAIRFPYPVVPIVRHHHENWDGTGYPDGLRGSDIPIGARILSVVDCFDALTSDRPYRPKLPDAEAIKILLDRRGTMYDPLVVDTFIDVHEKIAPNETQETPYEAEGLVAITRGSVVKASDRTEATRLEPIAASSEESLVLYDLARGLAGRVPLGEVGQELCSHIRRLMPASTCVLYLYDSSSDELVVGHVTGEHAGHFSGLRIPRGQRLTGWVGANRMTIVNSDPVLDLGEVARNLRPRLNSCLSAAIVADNTLLGVLTLYSVSSNAFSDDNRRVLETVTRQLANVIPGNALPVEGPGGATSLESFGLEELEEVLNAPRPAGLFPVTILFVEVGARTVRGAQRDLEGERLIRSMAVAVRTCLRVADAVTAYGPSQLLVVLGRTGSRDAKAIADRIVRVVQERASDSLGKEVVLDVRVGAATAPDDDSQLAELIPIARERGRRSSNRGEGPPSIH
jgi:putative nucleotidyltransferase with HDIG domain